MRSGAPLPAGKKTDKDGDIPMYALAGQEEKESSEEDGGAQAGCAEEYDEKAWWNYYDDNVANLLCAIKGKGGKGKKGKGKREDWAPRRLVCNKCGGFDHPERLCPSVSTCSHGCTTCNGKGHFEKDCVAMSKEEYLAKKKKAAGAAGAKTPWKPPSWRTKGGGKG